VQSASGPPQTAAAAATGAAPVLAPALPSGVVAPGDVRDAGTATNLSDLLSGWALQQPGTVALVDAVGPRRTLTWAELDRRVDAVAAGLGAAGLLAGHRLALLGRNSAAFVVAYLAALRAGVVAVPLNPQSTTSELASLLADCGARVLLADPDLAGPDRAAGGPALPGVVTLPLTEDGLDALARPGVPVSSPRDVETLAVLLYTAGTSGRPKAAMLTHRALLGHVEHVHRTGLLTSTTTVLGGLPLFHVFGLNAVLGSWLRAGARLVVVDGYPDDLCGVLVRERVTNLPLAPPTLHRLLADPGLDAGIAGVTTVVSGAAPLPESLAAAFTARTGRRVEQGYGLTEAAPGVSLTGPAPAGSSNAGTDAAGVRGQGHVGRPLPGVEVRVGDGRDPTEPGELSVRGDNLFSGYWPDGAGGPDAEGWFATGDIGYLEDGELHLVDRARELVIVNGFNVYPAEVEQVLLELPEVAAVAVVGRPDVRSGEQVVAFVVPGAGADPAGLAQRVAAHCGERLARFKRPTLVQVTDELPRGATGKVRKGLLRQRAEAVT